MGTVVCIVPFGSNAQTRDPEQRMPRRAQVDTRAQGIHCLSTDLHFNFRLLLPCNGCLVEMDVHFPNPRLLRPGDVGRYWGSQIMRYRAQPLSRTEFSPFSAQFREA